MAEVTVADCPERSRYEVRVDGALAGRLDYRRQPGRIEFPHTEVDARYEGRGLGSQLARRALDDARAAGLTVVPTCSFIRDYLARHPEYQSDGGG